MSGDQTSRANLWREAWTACKQNFVGFLPWMLGFGVLLIICNYYFMPDEIQKAMERVQSLMDQTDPPDHVTSSITRLAHGFAALIQLVGFFYFTVLYMKRSSAAPSPELSVGNFFGWLGQIIMAVFAILGVALGALAVSALLGTLAVMFLHLDEKMLALMAAVATVFGLIYGAGKFMLVSPLALSQTPSPVKTSWKMTRGNWWRLIWHYFMLISVVWLVLIVVFLVPMIALFMTTPLAPDSTLLIGGLSVVFGLSSAVVLASGSVFCCVACRILSEEQ